MTIVSEQSAKKRSEHAESLTFSWLYGRVQRYVSETKGPGPTRFERWSFWIAMAAAAIGFAIAQTWSHWLPGEVAIWLVRACLAVELGGVALSLIGTLRRELPQFLRSRQVHADEMDLDFGKWRELALELQEFPAVERDARLRFVEELRSNMDRRMGLVFGSVQRLGVFPLLVALYLQFRDWTWGDWTSAFDVNLVEGILVFAMFVLYGTGWLLIGLRTRMDTYASVLRESMEGDTGRS
ncbi:hypothetical protein [Marilutibacter aestuarii]|nr:hypothetical protein [Lysobacter aestuarii]